VALELSRDYHDPKQKRKTKKVIEVDLAGSIAFAHGWRAPVTGGHWKAHGRFRPRPLPGLSPKRLG
jgi:hypothetical protein